MIKITRIGHITPSSNIILEPLTYAMSADFGRSVTHHFARTPVMHVGLDAASEAQFQLEQMLVAGRLLADAPLDALIWNGTSASWRGIENDIALCDAISRETGLPSSTSTLAFHRAFREFGLRKVGLALPYTVDIADQIAREYTRQGSTITDVATLGLVANQDIGNASPEAIRNLLRQVAASKPDCIAVVCTNLNATDLIVEMEHELGITIIDSIAVTFWEACQISGINAPIRNWGRLLGGIA